MEFDAIYHDLDVQTRVAAARTGLGCPEGCGACCQKPSRAIEASVAELRPLARHLWEVGRGEEVFERARKAGASGWCVLHEPLGQVDGFSAGRCSQYPWRPLTCRLFGFSASVDKAGRLRPLLSAVMRKRDPGLGARLDRAIAGGVRIPEAARWRLRLAEIDPLAATDLLPLNEALARALEAEGLTRRYRTGPDGASETETRSPVTGWRNR